MQGAHEIWIISIPKSYNRQISRELEYSRRSIHEYHRKLDDTDERFSPDERRNLAVATNDARRYVMDTLAELAGGGQRIRRVVRRWFCGSNMSSAGVTQKITEISIKLRQILSIINSNKLIYTDMPYLRNATSKEDKNLAKAIAFVYGGMVEKIPIIYIEDSFFDLSHYTMSVRLHWAGTVIHEISHLILSTSDHKYSFQGMCPDHILSPSMAIENADTWNIFCLDACGFLTSAQKTKALYGRSMRPPVAPPVPPKKLRRKVV